MTTNGMRAVHPGEVLREDYLGPLGLSINALARALHVPASRIGDIVLERRAITADTALRLARHFGGTPEDAQGWLNMQAAYDLKIAAKTSGKAIVKEVAPREASIGSSGMTYGRV